MKIFNYTSIILIAIGVFLMSRFLWIGSSEQIDVLRLNFVGSTFERTISFSIFGLVLLLPILGLNLLKKKKRIYKVGIIGFFSFLVSAFLGSILFFNFF